MPTFALVTFGCKVNPYEGQALREELMRRGYGEVRPEEGADLYVVNTCTGTETVYQDAEKPVRKPPQSPRRAGPPIAPPGRRRGEAFGLR